MGREWLTGTVAGGSADVWLGYTGLRRNVQICGRV